nr:translation initiation factor IF-2-like [Pan troglodytes]XP_054533452.1 translation initiation factor IF-2-like [Pan troglodytes]
MPSSEPRGPTEPALRRPSSAERPLAQGPSSSPSAGRAPGAMASPSGSSEATGKPRGRDGRPRREEDDVPPEEKRLRLLLEGGSAQPDDCEDGEDAPRPGRKETGTQTGGDGRGVSDAGAGVRGCRGRGGAGDAGRGGGSLRGRPRVEVGN